jgi:anaphase-promoting complex subunit 4
MESSRAAELSLIEAKTFNHEIRPELVRCCPTMDLIAYATIDERVEIFRFGGQKAFHLQRKDSNFKVTSICWKYNGTSKCLILPF